MWAQVGLVIVEHRLGATFAGIVRALDIFWALSVKRSLLVLGSKMNYTLAMNNWTNVVKKPQTFTRIDVKLYS
jgi:hypothetical protein